LLCSLQVLDQLGSLACPDAVAGDKSLADRQSADILTSMGIRVAQPREWKNERSGARQPLGNSAADFFTPNARNPLKRLVSKK
jgi:hypothetical protein